MKTGSIGDRIWRPLAEEAGTGLVQVRPFVNVVRDAFCGRKNEAPAARWDRVEGIIR
jgi:hypothetical protein